MFNSFPSPRPDSGGSNIKSLQSNQQILSVSSATANITITNVDLSKSIVIIRSMGPSATAGSDSSVRGKLTTSTNLLLTRISFNTDVTVFWTVIEFNNVKSLQSGLRTFTATTAQVTISSVNLNKTLLFYSYSCNDPNAGLSLVAGKILNSTTLEFSERTGTNATNIEWQVIEFI